MASSGCLCAGFGVSSNRARDGPFPGILCRTVPCLLCFRSLVRLPVPLKSAGGFPLECWRPHASTQWPRIKLWRRPVCFNPHISHREWHSHASCLLETRRHEISGLGWPASRRLGEGWCPESGSNRYSDLKPSSEKTQIYWPGRFFTFRLRVTSDSGWLMSHCDSTTFMVLSNTSCLVS